MVCVLAMFGLSLLLCDAVLAAEPLTLVEPSTDARVFDVTTSVTTTGKLKIGDNTTQAAELPLEAAAQFAFRERRLPPAGRDALALRAVREFSNAQMTAEIEKQASTLALPKGSQVIVSSGRREGVLNYSTTTLLTRDLADLLDMPGDTLALIGLLPDNPVEAGSEWQVPELGRADALRD